MSAAPSFDAEASIATIAHRLLPNEEQTEFASAVRSFLARHSPDEAVRAAMDTESGFDARTWRGLAAELGIVGLALPESLGGAGATFAEVLIVTEELGRTLSCVPWFSHVVLAQTLLGALPPTTAVHELLGRLATGETRATVAFGDDTSRWDQAAAMTVSASAAGQWTLTGHKNNVVDGHTADILLVAAPHQDTLAVLAVDGQASGLQRTPLPTMDLTRKQARLDFHEVPATMLSEDGSQAFAQMLTAGAAALAAESLGGAQVVLDSSVDYAKTRYQFGRPIGSFQAIKHKCADMLMAVEGARSAVCYARATASVEGGGLTSMASSIAKATAGDAYRRCAADNIQIHGGIGFTWEHPAHLYYKRARANSLMLGSSREHRAVVAGLLDL